MYQRANSIFFSNSCNNGNIANPRFSGKHTHFLTNSSFLTILLYSLLLHFLEYKYMFSKDYCNGESKTFSRCLLLKTSH